MKSSANGLRCRCYDINKTQIMGRVDIRLEYGSDQSQDGADAAPPIFEAIQQQLELKLVPGKGLGESLVVDSVDLPSEN
jgi:uncharacterized protein (TIGR03435 family)